jgi:predicted esterase
MKKTILALAVLAVLGLGIGIGWLEMRDSSRPKDISFIAACDDTTQRYALVLPKGFRRRQPHDVMIVLHGYGNNRWQFVRDPRKEAQATRDVVAKHDMIMVAPDYRTNSWMGPKAEADLVQIIGAVKKKYKVSRVFVLGGSMGGMGCLTFTALHPDLVDGVIAINGTANMMEYAGFQDAIAASFGGGKTAVPDEYKKRSAESWPERFTMPVGLTASGKDTTVPPQSFMRFANTLKSRGAKVLFIYREEMGHETAYDDCLAVSEFVITNAAPAKMN